MRIYCNHCRGLVDSKISIRFVKTKPDTFKNPDDKRNQKWNFMLRADCETCKQYIKFLPQTDEIISTLQDKQLL